MYNVDPNNNKKQIPKGRPKTAYGKVTTPAEETIQNRPNHILVNTVSYTHLTLPTKA